MTDEKEKIEFAEIRGIEKGILKGKQEVAKELLKLDRKCKTLSIKHNKLVIIHGAALQQKTPFLYFATNIGSSLLLKIMI